MDRLALVAGNSLLGSSYGLEAPAKEGAGVPMHELGDHLVLQRHGADHYTLPHRIDHGANMRALAMEGVDRVLALGSVGSTRRELTPGTFVAPDDFIAPGPTPSIHSDARAHAVAAFDEGWRERVIEVWARLAETPLVDGGVYWQTVGPRLETPAEIRLIAAHAQLVGMTIASEAVAAFEVGIAYAAVCSVDNLANGIGSAPLTAEEVEAGKGASQSRLLAALATVIPELAADPE